MFPKNALDGLEPLRIRIFFFSNVAKSNLCGELIKGQMLFADINLLYALSLIPSTT